VRLFGRRAPAKPKPAAYSTPSYVGLGMGYRKQMHCPAVPTVALNNGVEIPQLGFGTYKMPPEETEAAVRTALDVGYRHIDTAAMYRNEAAVGAAIARSGLPREDVFVTTKLNNGFHAYDAALAAFDRSLAELGMDYVDLYLIHWPLPALDRYREAWRALETIYASGRARAIGVSNFQPAHLDRLLAEAKVVPAVNQIELHPYLGQREVSAYDSAHGIATQAWSPLGRGRVLDDPVLAQIGAAQAFPSSGAAQAFPSTGAAQAFPSTGAAQAFPSTGAAQAFPSSCGPEGERRIQTERSHGVSPAQVVIRWHLQHGRIVIPKSATPSRIAENFDVFGFELTPDEMAAIDALDRGQRFGSHPDEENRTDR